MNHPVLKKSGVIRRADFAHYLLTLAPHMGFHLDSPDFESVRDTGHGLHITRRKEKLVRLELELQYRWATALTCARVAIEAEGVAYKVSTDVAHYDNGSITETQTAAGGVHLLTPSDETYTCPALDVVSDFDPEFDYGDLISIDDTVFSEPLDEELLLPAAAAALEDDGAPYVAVTSSWYTDENPPTDISQNLGVWVGAGDPLLARRINSFRYRWKITGRASVHIEWEQGGSTLDTTVSPGGASSWYDDNIPATQGVNDTIDNVVLTVL